MLTFTTLYLFMINNAFIKEAFPIHIRNFLFGHRIPGLGLFIMYVGSMNGKRENVAMVL